MEDMYYNAYDFAIIFIGMELGCRDEVSVMKEIWEKDRSFINGAFRDKQRQLLLEIAFYESYILNKEIMDKEFPRIQKDLLAVGSKMKLEILDLENYNLHLFFKKLRINILYGRKRNEVRMKLRTLLKAYNYKRRSPKLIECISKSLYFYHLQTYLKDGVPCQIEDVDIDDMIIFKAI